MTVHLSARRYSPSRPAIQELTEAQDGDSSRKRRTCETLTNTSSPSANLNRCASSKLHTVMSLPDLRVICNEDQQNERPMKKSCSASCLTLDIDVDPDPQTTLISILQSQGYKANIYKSSELNDFFLEMSDESTAAYDQDVITAVRDGDLHTLREMHKNGRPLQCSNKFGESLVHMACRRGLTDVVRFLIKEAGVTLRVKDDVGRSPLHDAFWSSEPNFDLLDLLIEHDADLLLVQDNRGHLPFKYARHNQWNAWHNYLLNRTEVICLNTFMDTMYDEVIG
jgi:hypothetical protein